MRSGRLLLVLACLLRAFVPVDAGGIELVRGAGSGGWTPGDASAFACRDHDCGCRTAEQCRASCCCYSGAPAQAQAGLMLTACHGGGPQALPSVAEASNAVLPEALALDLECAHAGAVLAVRRCSPGPEVEPRTPPPRAASSSA